MWATRPYYPCTIAFAGIKVWTIAVPTYMVLIVDLINHLILSLQFFNVVPCEDYLGVYALHKHDIIGGKPVSIMILVGRSIIASYCTYFPPVCHISVELCHTLRKVM